MANETTVKGFVQDWLQDIEYPYTDGLNNALDNFLDTKGTYAITFLKVDNPVLDTETERLGLNEEDNEEYYLGAREFYVRQNGKKSISILPEQDVYPRELVLIWRLDN